MFICICKAISGKHKLCTELNQSHNCTYTCTHFASTSPCQLRSTRVNTQTISSADESLRDQPKAFVLHVAWLSSPPPPPPCPPPLHRGPRPSISTTTGIPIDVDVVDVFSVSTVVLDASVVSGMVLVIMISSCGRDPILSSLEDSDVRAARASGRLEQGFRCGIPCLRSWVSLFNVPPLSLSHSSICAVGRP